MRFISSVTCLIYLFVYNLCDVGEGAEVMGNYIPTTS